MVIDGVKPVEVEGDEYHICDAVYKNSEVLSFENKTNKQILKEIFQKSHCVFEQGKAGSGDFIVCKLVVNDPTKRTIKGTAKEIIDTLQLEKHCNVSNNSGSMRDGGKIDNEEDSEDLEKAEKSSNFIVKLSKDEIRHIIFGNGKVRNGANIQATAHYLRKSSGSISEAKNSKFYKKQEEKFLKEYITKNNLWTTISDQLPYFGEGCEQTIYLFDKKNVIKTNSGVFYNSWEDYLYSLLLHNYFFPNTAYELIGFKYQEGQILSVVKQVFIEDTEDTDLENVKEFLYNNGFIIGRNNDYDNPDLGIILEDLHDENVLTENGILQFIDTCFYISSLYFTNKKELGGDLENEFKSNNFIVNETKDDGRHIISGTSEVSTSRDIQSEASNFRKSARSIPVDKNSRLYKEQEAPNLNPAKNYNKPSGFHQFSTAFFHNTSTPLKPIAIKAEGGSLDTDDQIIYDNRGERFNTNQIHIIKNIAYFAGMPIKHLNEKREGNMFGSSLSYYKVIGGRLHPMVLGTISLSYGDYVKVKNIISKVHF